MVRPTSLFSAAGLRFAALLLALLSLFAFDVVVILAHGGDTSKIHACVKNGGAVKGNVRIVGANDTCASNEYALDWNIQGPQGPQGPPGQSGIEVVTTVFKAPAQSVGSSGLASCPSGKVATGGGILSDTAGLEIEPITSAPTVTAGQPTGWFGRADNGSNADVNFTVYAICAAVAP
jgi:hypothetical protein